ncbi:ATP-binding protein [Frankia sp. AgB1.9]|uniref:type IV secretory system conjugative DNA transfer family protein n=1 Tax=unclassified Frankia TaxID=2632575 RepID=UPI001931FE21|nr:MULTISPECIES: type IV secretion system DNA-binding domain-containing protein [unclassified Frankia]MBL7491180.1 ATP-binding protein [Frankia sp. AgW1.1]MBL7553709.1 ATP-binding protein [Frankia sp. AgB1.9]MBL7618003.1 ATP-binding protein [Frankia sp. AgB1.8]
MPPTVIAFTSLPPPPPRPAAPHLPPALASRLAGILHWAATLLTRHPLLTGVALMAAVVMASEAQVLLRRHRHTRLATGARVVEVLVPPEVTAGGAGAFWGQMAGLLRPPLDRLIYGQPHLGWEIVAGQSGTAFRLWVPGQVPPGLVERAVQAAWPGARTDTRPATPPLPEDALAVGGRLQVARRDVLPLRVDPEGDPVRALLAAAADLDTHEQAVVQILARPVTGRRLRRAARDAERQRGQHRPTLLIAALDLLTSRPRPSTGSGRRPGPTPPEEAAASRAIGVKQIGPRFAVTVLYTAATSHTPADQAARRAALRVLRGRAHALGSVFALYAGHNYLRRHRLPHPIPALAGRRLGRGALASVEELAALAHLPLDTAVPGLARAGAAAVAAPAAIPTGGPDVKILGDTDAGRRRPVGLRVADARHHVHVLGATGSGKSTLLANMILDDVEAGRGTVVVDPKGDLVNDLLARLPADVADRVILLDPQDNAPPPCLNILDGADPDLATDQLVGIFRRIWADSWGPRTDDLLRATALTLLTRPQAAAGEVPTLMDVVTLLTDPQARRTATTGIKDPILAGFWNWYNALSDGARAQAIGPVLNKLRALLLRKFARQALAAGRSTVDLADVLDHGGLLLCRIPKGTVGEDACQIVGSIVLAKVWQTVLTRAHRPPHERPDATVALDECQNFLTLPGSIEDMLAEARGYRLGLVLAHQHLRQLPTDLADALATNARTKIVFACSPQDAVALARHTAPVLSEHDLARLPAFTAATRLVVHSADTAAFTLRTRPLPPAVPGRATVLRHAARRHTVVGEPRPAHDPRPQPETGAPR